jgi:hypothetical protein
MGRLEDRLLDHPVRERIAALRSASGALDEDARRAVDEQYQGATERIPKVLDFVEGALAAADPALVTEASLAGIDSHLGQAADTITRLPSDPAQGLALDQQLEAAIGAAVPLLSATPFLVDRAERASEAFDTALSGSVEQLKVDTTQLAAELDALDQRRLGADDAITEEDEVRRQALLEQAEALKSAVATEQQRLDQLVPTFEQQFSEAQDARQATFDEVRVSLEASAESVSTDLAKQADTTKSALSGEANAVLTEVKARRDEVNDLYRVVTDSSTAGAFNEEAATQKTTADEWRQVAIGFGIAAAVIALGSIAWAAVEPNGVSSAGAIVAKVTATLAAAAIAAYAGRQSGRHREREEGAKRLELQLVALGPFIRELGEDEQRDVRKAFVERAFTGQGPPEVNNRGGIFHRRHDGFGLTQEMVNLIVAASRAGSQQS